MGLPIRVINLSRSVEHKLNLFFCNVKTKYSIVYFILLNQIPLDYRDLANSVIS